MSSDSDADIYGGDIATEHKDTPQEVECAEEEIEEQTPKVEEEEEGMPTYRVRMKQLDWWITDMQIKEALETFGTVKDIYFSQIRRSGQFDGTVDIELSTNLPMKELEDGIGGLKFEDKPIRFDIQNITDKLKKNQGRNENEEKETTQSKEEVSSDKKVPLFFLYEDETNPIPPELLKYVPIDRSKEKKKEKEKERKEREREERERRDRDRDRERDRRDRDRDRRDRDRDRDRDREDRDRDRDDRDRRDRDRDRDRDWDDRDRRDRDRDRDRDRRDRDRDRERERDRDRRDRDRDDRDRRDRRSSRYDSDDDRYDRDRRDRRR